MAHGPAEWQIAGEERYVFGEGIWRIGDEAGFAMFDEEARAAFVGDHGGDTGSHGFDYNISIGICFGWKNEDVHGGVGLGERFPFENAGEDGIAKIGFEPGTLAAFADNQEAAKPGVAFVELTLQAGEGAEVLFGSEAAGEAEQDIRFWGVRSGAEESCVAAARHAVDGPTGALLEHLEEFRTGCEENLS